MDLKYLFSPKSIAFIGASPDMEGGKLPFLQVIQTAGFKGELYPVNPSYKTVSGLKAFKSIEDLPEGIDLAIVSISVRHAYQILISACKKKIKFVHFFTSGFSEMGNCELEQSFVKTAKKFGTRIVGPNCVGIHSREAKVSFSFLPLTGKNGNNKGDVAFLGQSGGLSINFLSALHSRKIGLSKAVSYGNQIDLTVVDYMKYFAKDDSISTIAGYIEDVKDGRDFLKILQQTTSDKPVIILKGGVSEEGSKAAQSHTGAMSGKHTVFSAAIKQNGGILVDTFEQLSDMVMLASSGKFSSGARIGFIGAGGGTSVIFTDFAVQKGFFLPELENSTKKIIASKITDFNTSTTNPVDLGAFGMDFDVIANSMKAVDSDKNIDQVFVQLPVDFIFLVEKAVFEKGINTMVETGKKMNKPVFIILSKITENDIQIEAIKIKLFEKFREAGLVVFLNMPDALYSLQGMINWKNYTKKINQNTAD